MKKKHKKLPETPLLSRWGKFRRLVGITVTNAVEGGNLNEQVDELLESALALEVCSLILMDLANKLGNQNPGEDVGSRYDENESLINSYVDISSSMLAKDIDPEEDHPTRLKHLFTMPPGDA